MKRLEIETSLRSWAKEMVSRFEWLTIRFEYNNVRHRYLVSYYYATNIDDNDPFYKEALDYEDKMNILYMDDAPLFCDEESLFKLSTDAETIGRNLNFTESLVVFPDINSIVYGESVKCKIIDMGTDESYFSTDSIFDDAA